MFFNSPHGHVRFFFSAHELVGSVADGGKGKIRPQPCVIGFFQASVYALNVIVNVWSHSGKRCTAGYESCCLAPIERSADDPLTSLKS